MGDRRTFQCHLSYLSGRTLPGCPWTAAEHLFGDSYTRLPSASTKVKRRWQSDFLKNNRDLKLNSCSVPGIKWEILTHHYLSKWQGRKQTKKQQYLLILYLSSGTGMHHLQPLLILKKLWNLIWHRWKLCFWSLKERQSKSRPVPAN